MVSGTMSQSTGEKLLRPGEGRTETVTGILRGGLQGQGCHLDGRWEAKVYSGGTR